MAKLNAKQKRWVERVNAVLAECPTPDDIGFYTVGDAEVFLFDLRRRAAVYSALDKSASDFCLAVAEVGAGYTEVIKFPQNVDSTAG